LGTGLKVMELPLPPRVGGVGLPTGATWADLANWLGLALIWVAAVLTAMTGWEYFQKSLPFLKDAPPAPPPGARKAP
jgi:CDP-diacylglycerol--glycerol-3-phosphate 3-phosphatidyltransferase